MKATDILIEAAGRPLEVAQSLRDELTAETANAHPGEHDNSAAWLLWHTGREIDVQLAHLNGSQQVWQRDDFGATTGLGEQGAGLGYGHDSAQARAIVVENVTPLLDYLAATTQALVDYLGMLGDDDLDEVIDPHWDPPVTRGARLVSIVDDAAQHVGQIGYALGILRNG